MPTELSPVDTMVIRISAYALDMEQRVIQLQSELIELRQELEEERAKDKKKKKENT